MARAARNPAFGAPGIEPRWTRSDKQAVGTAYSASSRIWFTLAAGIVSEVYYPTIDRPQTRDLQYLITDGKTFFHDERRHLKYKLEQIAGNALGYRLTNTNHEQGYRLLKEVISDPHQPCLLVNTRFEAEDGSIDRLRLFALLAPHLGVGGAGNTGYLTEVAGMKVLMAHKDGVWLALGATIPFLRRSCGFVGKSDGWTDLADNFEMDWEFDFAQNGNIALVGELDLRHGREFTLGMAFGDSEHDVQTTLVQSLGVAFAEQRQRFVEQWHRVCGHVAPDCEELETDGLYRRSHSLLLAHEDKAFPGATIASLSIPWGECKGDEDLGGYHLVWPRDMVHIATALLATGNTDTPYRALVYLACSQIASGGFYQSFWIDGDPYWTGVQLDEVSFSILLAWRVKKAGALRQFDPYPMVKRAAEFLVREGPATGQERWEENSGYSPSTLAANIAALICAAEMAKEQADEISARFLHEYADFLECHVERWTVTRQGTLLPGVPRHYIRVLQMDLSNPDAPEDPDTGIIEIKNRPPGSQYLFPAKDVVDAGFLELVRYGIRRPNDPLVEDSLRVVDHVLKVDTPFGPCWRRYNHDGYGQRDDGGPFLGWGRGRAWPLLTGERGHYELAAGRDAALHLQTMERFATDGLLSEQVWDEADRPDERLWFGRPTGAAMPLVWAHAEYLTLSRSIKDGKVFDLLPAVARRYLGDRRDCKSLEIWKRNRHPRWVTAGWTLRVMACAPFMLHWSDDDWQTSHDTQATATPLGVAYVDLPTDAAQRGWFRFTMLWTADNRWEGQDYAVEIRSPS